MLLAIAQNELIYYGNENLLNAVYPVPNISKADVGDTFGKTSTASVLLFREDFFEPTQRIRRGRFYVSDDPSRRQWPDDRINHYPYAQPIGSCSPFFDSYRSFIPSSQINVSKRPIILLGDSNYKTAWHIIGSECLFNSEILFTLKSSSTLGILPDLNESAIPPEKRDDILENVEKVADAAHIYVPVPMVDVCREAARSMLAAWLPTIGKEPKGDLGKLISKIPCDYVGLQICR